MLAKASLLVLRYLPNKILGCAILRPARWKPARDPRCVHAAQARSMSEPDLTAVRQCCWRALAAEPLLLSDTTAVVAGSTRGHSDSSSAAVAMLCSAASCQLCVCMFCSTDSQLGYATRILCKPQASAVAQPL